LSARGKVLAITFIYMTCTDTWPLSTAKMAAPSLGSDRFSFHRFFPLPSIRGTIPLKLSHALRKHMELISPRMGSFDGHAG
jgi:hypothetical protein